ncbi:MAG: DUF2723 domain-containing protein [Chloroflexi bacterium]|nr:DUF2723 domain-containing protein [Chloroflexota bacterium]
MVTQSRSVGRISLLIAAVLFGASLAVYALTMAPGLTWRHDGADGGDLARAAMLGSVPHPTGYPTYLLLARLFLQWPAGDAAYRLNLLSAVCTAAAVALFGLWQARAPASPARYAGAGAGALALAFAPLVWSQALIAEVHGLQLLLAVVAMAAIDRCGRSLRPRHAFAAGLAFGAGLGNHVTLVFLAPVVLAALWRCRTARAVAPPVVLGLALGLSVYLVLPLSAVFGAASPWGNVDTLDAFVAYLTGDIYHSVLFGVPAVDGLNRWLSLPSLVLAEFAPWGVLAAAVGASAIWRRSRLELVSLAACVLASALFSAGYNTSDAYRYLMVAWLVLAIWLAEGVSVLGATIAERGGTRAFAFAVTVWAAFSALWIAGRWPEMDISSDTAAESETAQVLAALPPRALLVTNTDRQTFALWYHIDSRGQRPDAVVIDRTLLAYAPYRAYLSRRWGVSADAGSDLRDWVAALGVRPVMVLDPAGILRAPDALDAPAP